MNLEEHLLRAELQLTWEIVCLICNARIRGRSGIDSVRRILDFFTSVRLKDIQVNGRSAVMYYARRQVEIIPLWFEPLRGPARAFRMQACSFDSRALETTCPVMAELISRAWLWNRTTGIWYNSLLPELFSSGQLLRVSPLRVLEAGDPSLVPPLRREISL